LAYQSVKFTNAEEFYHFCFVKELAVPSVRNDAVFLASVVGVTSVIAVAAGFLPGDWGFFVPYLVGSLSLVVLAVGSVAPGLFQVVIDKFSSSQGDYQERILRHEAAHFLTAYLVGLPIVGYSLDLGKEHVNLVDASVEKRIYEGLDANLLDRLDVVSMAGTANFSRWLGRLIRLSHLLPIPSERAFLFFNQSVTFSQPIPSEHACVFFNQIATFLRPIPSERALCVLQSDRHVLLPIPPECACVFFNQAVPFCYQFLLLFERCSIYCRTLFKCFRVFSNILRNVFVTVMWNILGPT